MYRIIDFDDYREYLRTHIKSLPHKGKGEISRMAHAIDVQSSMLSQVLGGVKTLSPDQASILAEYLQLSADEADYFLTLVLLDRAATPKLKERYQRRLHLLRQSLVPSNGGITNLNLGDKERELFFSTWYFIGIWLHSMTPGHHTLSDLSKRFNLAPPLVEKVVSFLVENQLCQYDRGYLSSGPMRVHIEGPSLIRSRHHMNWRVKGLEKTSSFSPPEFFYSFPMCLSASDVKIVRDLLFELTQNVDRVVTSSQSEKLWCLNVDWFEF